MDSPLLELGEKDVKLAITHQRVPSHDGEMNGALAIDNGQEPADQVVSFEVRQLAQVDSACAQMLGLVGVTTRTAQRALAGDFNGKTWLLAV